MDEISMVPSVLFSSSQSAIAGLQVNVCHDFLQLPPVKGLPVYISAASIKGFIPLDLWRIFQMVELTDVMLQRGDFEFISLLNKIR